VARLEELDAATVAADGSVLLQDEAGEDGIVLEAVAGQERLRSVERSRVEMVRAYAESPGCRRAALLGYFGEPFDPPCGNCDRCLSDDARPARADGDWTDRVFAVGDRVRHQTFGFGAVTAVSDGVVTVVFDSVGYRTLDARLAAEDGLLRLEPAAATEPGL
jgi:ATP-dependent DNA helicase RecQ